MNKKAIFWIVLIGVTVLTVVLGSLYKPAKKTETEKVVPVEVNSVKTGSIEETMELTGWVKANSVVDVKSKVGGRVELLEISSADGKTIAVEEGVEVKAGQQIAVIDHDMYQAQVDAARAAVKASEVEVADANREARRLEALLKGGSATEQNRDKAITAMQMAEARLNSARANLEMADINLRESSIRSPIDGVITAKHVDAGNLINVGQAIVTVADMKMVKIVVAASERYSGKIQAGMKVKVRMESLGEREFEAEVYSVYPSLDEQTHSIQAEIRLNNEKLQFRPGMFVGVKLILQHKKDAVVVPRDVVLGGKVDEPYVYLVEDGVAHKRIVKTGITEGAKIEIIEGLKAGESLVVNGMNYLIDGTKVEVVRLEDIK
jgi:membrane fusion protein (multidrug efflux system)